MHDCTGNIGILWGEPHCPFYAFQLWREKKATCRAYSIFLDLNERTIIGVFTKASRQLSICGRRQIANVDWKASAKTSNTQLDHRTDANLRRCRQWVQYSITSEEGSPDLNGCLSERNLSTAGTHQSLPRINFAKPSHLPMTQVDMHEGVNLG